MSRPIVPRIRKWYQDIDRNEIFRVVAHSSVNDYIQIQYFSGEISELDLDSWFSLHLEMIPPPEDSSGPFELSQEELGYSSEPKPPRYGSSPLSDLEAYDSYSSDDNYDISEKYDKYFDKKHFFENND